MAISRRRAVERLAVKTGARARAEVLGGAYSREQALPFPSSSMHLTAIGCLTGCCEKTLKI